MNHLETGKRGEDMAAEYLKGKGYRILERNVRHRVGEIDIVAQDPNGELVFVEVKTRRGDGFGMPEESVTPKKLAKMEKVAILWVQSMEKNDIMFRFDIISIRLSEKQEILHLIDVGQ